MNLVVDLGNEARVGIKAESKVITRPNNLPPVVVVFLHMSLSSGEYQLVLPEEYAKGIAHALSTITQKNIVVPPVAQSG